MVNFAVESHVDRSIKEASDFVATNVGGVQTLLEAAREHGVKRFVQVSTDEVYGQIEQGKFSETDCLEPRNPYAATKAAADLLAHSYHVTHGVPVVITRSSNNFGPRQHPEKLIPKFILRAEAGESLPLYGDGSNVREWTYVEDNCRGIRLLLEKGQSGEIYNIGSGNECTNLKVAEAILSAVGAPSSVIEYVEDRPGHDQRYALNISKITALGWEPKWTFEEGLRATIEYYIDRN